MAKRDYYEVLGLTKSATAQEIKKAYRKLAKELHPDRNKAADAEEKFKELQEAYEVLSDDQKRSAYDQYGFAGTQGFGGAGDTGGFGGYTDFSNANFGDLGDLFSSFFGGNFGGFDFGGAPRSDGRTRGSDIESTIRIEFLEAVFGVEKTITYKRKNTCETCKGTGAKDGQKVTCHECGGRGQVVRVQKTIFGNIQTVTTCPVCGGTGQEIKEKCPTCHGEGRVDSTENFTLNIPAGIPDGVTLRFTGRGNVGQNGGATGDLYITVEVNPHPRLERRGDDIYLDQEVDVVTATLGGEVKIPTVSGEIGMKIPAGTQPERVLRLSGKGGPKFKGGGHGDQYVRIKVKIPEKLSREQKRKWEDLRGEV
jgi:molecular chaperone DnaJ